MRVDPAELRALDLRAHALLEGVPLHDVWAVDLEGGGAGRTVVDLRALMSAERLADVNPAVRFLFRLRGVLGRLFGWDREPSGSGRGTPEGSYLERLTPEDRAASHVEPGTADGPFRVLWVTDREALSEVRNATVHAFSLFVLTQREGGYRLLWAIYVQPVSGITRWYMALIDPFRRFLIYPAVLAYVGRAWRERWAAEG